MFAFTITFSIMQDSGKLFFAIIIIHHSRHINKYHTANNKPPVSHYHPSWKYM